MIIPIQQFYLLTACRNSESDRYCETEKNSKGCDSWEMRQKCFKTCSQCEFSGRTIEFDEVIIGDVLH